MGSMYWLRVGMMIFVLAAVVWTMRFLQKPTLPQAADSFFSAEKVSLCPTRISWIETPAVRLEEHGTKWIRTPTGAAATSAKAEELDPIEVERWFTRFCSLTFEKLAGAAVQKESEAQVFKPLLNLGFVSGKAEQVTQAPNGDCQIMQQTFHPAGLSTMLEALPSLPKQAEPGTSH